MFYLFFYAPLNILCGKCALQINYYYYYYIGAYIGSLHIGTHFQGLLFVDAAVRVKDDYLLGKGGYVFGSVD